MCVCMSVYVCVYTYACGYQNNIVSKSYSGPFGWV